MFLYLLSGFFFVVNLGFIYFYEVSLNLWIRFVWIKGCVVVVEIRISVIYIVILVSGKSGVCGDNFCIGILC